MWSFSKLLWDITTKFLPAENLIRSQLFTNFDGYSLKNGAATPLTIWNFSRAWQAYFLSNNLQIWWENTSFNDLQMIWNNVFDTSIGFWFEKIWLSCTVHSYSLYLIYVADSVLLSTEEQTQALALLKTKWNFKNILWRYCVKARFYHPSTETSRLSQSFGSQKKID